MPGYMTMERLLRRLARYSRDVPRPLPEMHPLPTQPVQYLAAAAAGAPPVDEPVDQGSVTQDSGDWDLSTLNSTLAENFTLFTEGPQQPSSTSHGHVITDEAWPVSSFAVIKAIVLVVILVILLILSCKVTMQYIIKSSRREKR